MRETADAINDRAAAWVARIDRDGGDPATHAEFAAWLDGDDRRRGAFVRAQAAWTMLDRAGVLRAGLPADHVSAYAQPASRRRFLMAGGSAVASLCAIGGLGLGMRRLWTGERIETALGEIRRVPLRDGSVAAVNTDSSVLVDLQPHVRQIALKRGEAWFEVAHDRARPFIVESGAVRVQAVGTAFAVRRQGEGAQILVTEGVVEAWSEKEPANRQRIVAGDRAFVSDAGGVRPPTQAGPQIDRQLAWRSGQIVLEGETLGEAAAEFNRYNQIKVEVADQAMREQRLIGRFHINEPDAFARSAAIMFGARARQEGDVILLSRI